MVESKPPRHDAAIAGATAGFIARAATSPLDVIKIRMQLQLEPLDDSMRHVSKYRGAWHCTRTIVAEEGIRALWKGHVLGQTLSISFGAAQFAAYSRARGWLHSTLPEHPVLAEAVAGGWAGAFASALCHPLDVLRTRFAAQGEPRHYYSMVHAAAAMARHEGVAGFYRGLLPNLLGVTSNMALTFAYYDLFKATLRTLAPPTTNPTAVSESALAGLLAGALGKLTLMPLDTIKKRLQVQGFEAARRPFGQQQGYQGSLHCFREVVTTEGLLGLYKGASPAVVKSGLSAALTFVVYEQVLLALAAWRSSS